MLSKNSKKSTRLTKSCRMSKSALLMIVSAMRPLKMAVLARAVALAARRQVVSVISLMIFSQNLWAAAVPGAQGRVAALI